MPLKGENPITTYFPRVTADLKLKTSIQPKLKVAKRLRQPDEPTSESSRKKSKSRRQAGVEYSPNFANSSCSVERTSCSKTPWAVIEIRNTPPSSPTRPPLIPQITPPSSPLPELTPSPEHPPRTQRPPSLYRVDDQEVDVGLSAILSVSGKASHQEHDEMKLDLIPSSQTQVLDILRDEDAELFQACDPPSSIPTRNSEWIIPSQTSVDILAPQRNQNPSLSHTVQEELVASSQSQLMDLIPTSPITFDPDMVPSSQTQEFSYSQNAYSSQRGTIAMCKQRRSEIGVYVGDVLRSPSSNPYPGSQTSRENACSDAEGPERPTTIPGFQTPACRSCSSSPGHDEEHSQPSESLHMCRNTRTSLQESLPDVVKEFQDMFGETFESLPPDFPMSLRF